MKDALWIPSKILNIDSIDFLSKGILSEIESLTKLEKGCYSSNKILSDLFGVSVRTIINKINHLEELGFITITYNTDAKNTKFRIIRTSEKITPSNELRSEVVKKLQQESKLISKDTLDYTDIEAQDLISDELLKKFNL